MIYKINNKLAFIAILCTVFCFTTKAQDKCFMLLHPEDLQDLIEQADICSKEAGFPPTALKKIVKWPISDARASKELFQCVCRNTGYTDEEGHMVIDKFLSLKLMKGTKEEIVKLVKECNKVTLEDVVETAYAMGACIHGACAFAVEKKEN